MLIFTTLKYVSLPVAVDLFLTNLLQQPLILNHIGDMKATLFQLCDNSVPSTDGRQARLPGMEPAVHPLRRIPPGGRQCCGRPGERRTHTGKRHVGSFSFPVMAHNRLLWSLIKDGTCIHKCSKLHELGNTMCLLAKICLEQLIHHNYIYFIDNFCLYFSTN